MKLASFLFAATCLSSMALAAPAPQQATFSEAAAAAKPAAPKPKPKPAPPAAKPKPPVKAPPPAKKPPPAVKPPAPKAPPAKPVAPPKPAAPKPAPPPPPKAAPQPPAVKAPPPPAPKPAAPKPAPPPPAAKAPAPPPPVKAPPPPAPKPAPPPPPAMKAPPPPPAPKVLPPAPLPIPAPKRPKGSHVTIIYEHGPYVLPHRQKIIHVRPDYYDRHHRSRHRYSSHYREIIIKHRNRKHRHRSLDALLAGTPLEKPEPHPHLRTAYHKSFTARSGRFAKRDDWTSTGTPGFIDVQAFINGSSFGQTVASMAVSNVTTTSNSFALVASVDGRTKVNLVPVDPSTTSAANSTVEVVLQFPVYTPPLGSPITYCVTFDPTPTAGAGPLMAEPCDAPATNRTSHSFLYDASTGGIRPLWDFLDSSPIGAQSLSDADAGAASSDDMDSTLDAAEFDPSIDQTFTLDQTLVDGDISASAADSTSAEAASSDDPAATPDSIALVFTPAPLTSGSVLVAASSAPPLTQEPETYLSEPSTADATEVSAASVDASASSAPAENSLPTYSAEAPLAEAATLEAEAPAVADEASAAEVDLAASDAAAAAAIDPDATFDAAPIPDSSSVAPYEDAYSPEDTAAPTTFAAQDFEPTLPSDLEDPPLFAAAAPPTPLSTVEDVNNVNVPFSAPAMAAVDVPPPAPAADGEASPTPVAEVATTEATDPSDDPEVTTDTF